MKGIQNDELDLEMAMDGEEKDSLEAAKANKTWRALRSATRTSIELLDKVEPGKSLEELFKQQEQDPVEADDVQEDTQDGKGQVPAEDKHDGVTA